MGKRTVTFCVISSFTFRVFVCCLVFLVVSSSSSSSDESSTSDSTPNPITTSEPEPETESECSFLCERLQFLENENRWLKKSVEKLNKRVELPQEKCDEQFQLLSEKMRQLESRISPDHRVWPLTPPLLVRGPPEKQGRQEKQGPIDPRSLRSCSDATSSRSKKQRIYPHGNENSTSLEVLCDFETDGGGWTIIQKRSVGPKYEFNQNWSEYTKGFGSLDENFWLGLENIRALTKDGDQELRIELEDFEGNKAYAKYSSFSVSDASDFYRLSVSGFSENSTARDSMTNPTLGVYDRLNGSRFSTKDKDNDNYASGNCAVAEGGGGGWWYNECGESWLNGLYFEKGEYVFMNGIFWWSWKGRSYSLAKSEMKIRKRKSE